MLLDELDFPGYDTPDPRTGHIIVEVKTPGGLQLVDFSCSRRVIALPTGQLNAIRCPQHPFLGLAVTTDEAWHAL